MNLLGGRGAEEPTVYLKDIKVSAPFWPIILFELKDTQQCILTHTKVLNTHPKLTIVFY